MTSRRVPRETLRLRARLSPLLLWGQVGGFDTGRVTDMSALFKGASVFNGGAGNQAHVMGLPGMKARLAPWRPLPSDLAPPGHPARPSSLGCRTRST